MQRLDRGSGLQLGNGDHALPSRGQRRGRLTEWRPDDREGGADHGCGAVRVSQPDGEVGAGGGLLQHGHGGATHPHRLGDRGDIGRVACEHRDGAAWADAGIRECTCDAARLVVDLTPAAPQRGVWGTGDEPAGGGFGVGVHLVGECTHAALSCPSRTTVS